MMKNRLEQRNVRSAKLKAIAVTLFIFGAFAALLLWHEGLIFTGQIEQAVSPTVAVP